MPRTRLSPEERKKRLREASRKYYQKHKVRLSLEAKARRARAGCRSQVKRSPEQKKAYYKLLRRKAYLRRVAKYGTPKYIPKPRIKKPKPILPEKERIYSLNIYPDVFFKITTDGFVKLL